MKAIIFGLGSIGKRHMRLLLDYFPEVEVWHYNRGDYYKEIGPCYEKLVDRCRWDVLPLKLSQDDFAIISNPTGSHLSTALPIAEMGVHFLMEKPLGLNTQGLSHLISVVKAKNLTARVAYPLRYHPIVKHLKTIPPAGKFHFECRSDASKWPSARKLDHVVLELSHEIDLAQYLLGPVRQITGESDGVFASLVLKHDHAVSTAYLNLNSADEARFVRIDNHEYPIQVNDFLYIAQLSHIITKPESNLEEAGGLLRVMEEFIERATRREQPMAFERANRREKPKDV